MTGISDVFRRAMVVGKLHRQRVSLHFRCRSQYLTELTIRDPFQTGGSVRG